MLAGLFSKSIIRKGFGEILQEEANIWLKGRIPKRWSLASVALNFAQWTAKFWSPAGRSRICKLDSMKLFTKTRRTREEYRNCILSLMRNGLTRVVRESVAMKLHNMPNYVSVRN